VVCPVPPPLPPEGEALRRVSVRLIRPDERERFDRLLVDFHYLHSSSLAGECLRYLAEVDGEWVALLAFSAAALHLKGRDRWIGWTPRQRTRRLPFAVNNSRYLLLPERERFPNLASRVLALCLRRLSDDWRSTWGHPVLVVESFVDESLYRGTCYRACGFEPLGPTGGFARNSRDFYVLHERPKQLYVRALHPRARNWLRQARLPESLAEHEANVAGPCPFQAPALESLLDRFRWQFPDSRHGHGLYHRRHWVLASAAVATVMGACGFRAFEDTCKKFTVRQLRALGCLPDEEGQLRSPSDSTFRRVLAKLDPRLFAEVVGQWLLEQEPGALARLAVDGKTLRGSGRRDGKPLQLLAAMTHRLCLTLGQIPIDEKSNEIPALAPLLRRLSLAPGTLITADALHCQQESARMITQELAGDYLFGLKGNQDGILERAERLLAQQAFPPGEHGEVGEAP
jgi:hypothetical protein